MKKVILVVIILIVIILLGLLINQLVKINTASSRITSLKKGCIQATIKAIELEIEKHQKWLEIPDEELSPGAVPKEEIKAHLKNLQADLEKYKNMKVEDYTLPQKLEVVADINELKEGDLLEIEGLSRSGPFYHVVGIVGDDYTAVKKGKYILTLYLVYPRYYPFTSFYVYIADYKLK
ncbi:MAG: hypothetical protein K6343_00760 [Caldisericaceae bacterium]